MVDFNSPFYPYEKIQTGYNTFKGAEQIPYQILQYLSDLPDSNGYQPVDDNSRARVRLMKYLWHDGADPLNKTLPTPQEKLSLRFDGNNPDLTTDEDKAQHPKGYRLYPVPYYGQAQTTAESLIKCYIGRVVNMSNFISSVGINFEILCNVNYDTTTKTTAYNRSYDMEQAIIEALNGVNMTGIGTFSISRGDHPDNGSRPISDTGTNVGRHLHISLTWAESGEQSNSF